MKYWLQLEFPRFFEWRQPMDTRHCFEAPTDEEAIRYCEDLLPITFTTKGDAAKGQVMEFLPVILTRFREEGEDTFFGIVEVKQWRKER